MKVSEGMTDLLRDNGGAARRPSFIILRRPRNAVIMAATRPLASNKVSYEMESGFGLMRNCTNGVSSPTDKVSIQSLSVLERPLLARSGRLPNRGRQPVPY